MSETYSCQFLSTASMDYLLHFRLIKSWVTAAVLQPKVKYMCNKMPLHVCHLGNMTPTLFGHVREHHHSGFFQSNIFAVMCSHGELTRLWARDQPWAERFRIQSQCERAADCALPKTCSEEAQTWAFCEGAIGGQSRLQEPSQQVMSGHMPELLLATICWERSI